MGVPDFEADGLLPQGPLFQQVDGQTISGGHECSEDELRDRFVNSFIGSVYRPTLFQQYEHLARMVQRHFDCFLVLVSGSFVTSKLDPEDIYLVFEIPGIDLEQADSQAQWEIDWLLNQRETAFGESHDLTVFTGLVRTYPEGHHKHQLGLAEQVAERYMASTPSGDSDTAGYLELLLCEGGDTSVDAFLDAIT